MINKFGFLLSVSFFYAGFIFAQTEVRVMSFNIRLDVASDGENRWDLRKDKVAGLMNYYEADFIGGQEVTHPQLQYLRQSLNRYDYIGVGRDDGREEGEYSCIFFRKDKFTPVQSSTFWLSPWPDSVSFGWNAACRRVCTYGLFKSIQTGELLWVFNTHFDHISGEARLESAKLIIRKIGELNKEGLPVVLSGDFNSRPDDPPSRYILEHMKNSRAISPIVWGGPDTWNAFKFNSKPDGCIDYIFVSDTPRIRIRKFATLTDSYEMKYPSDHFPVMATLILDK